MGKIKIFYGITKGNWGGAQKYVYDLATGLPRERFEVSVISGQPGPLGDKLIAQNIKVFNLNSLGRDINLSRDLVAFWRLLKILLRHKPDILHLNSPKMGLLGALVGRLAGIKKIIYTSHGWPFLENRSIFGKIFFRILCWKITWLCHETIVISKSEQRNKKFHLIYNGIENINFLDKKLAREKLNLPENSLVVGTIAELHSNKGLEYLLEATKNIDATLVIIGDGELESELKLKANSSKLTAIFPGNIPNAATFLPAFDIFVLPSIKEGLPYVILEAGLAGLPVIASRVGGIPEIVENGVSGLLVKPKNSADVAEKINYLIAHPELQKIYGANLRERVQNNFGLEKMVAKTTAIYKQ